MNKEKVINHLTPLKHDFCKMLKEKFNFDVVRMNIKHNVDMGQSDVIKFTVSVDNESKFIYVYVNCQDQKTIHISTDIGAAFLDNLSNVLMHKEAMNFFNDFNQELLNFSTKYSLFKTSTNNKKLQFKPYFGFIKSHSSHSYFYIMQPASQHIINTKLYKIKSNAITILSKIMFRYENNNFISYTSLKLKFGAASYDFNLYSAQKMKKDLSTVLDKLKTEIEPSIKESFEKLFDVKKENFKDLDPILFDDYLSILAMNHI